MELSGSYRKTPIMGWCSDSDKTSKRKANRKYRHREKNAIEKDSEVIPLKREVTNVYDFAKDGKGYMQNPKPEWLRK
ncbi:MAG: hypothetical protein QG635_1284 [Bacteroidota bacterium]|nr:hypothetical protein [Bacteroidota bacterium]